MTMKSNETPTGAEQSVIHLGHVSDETKNCQHDTALLARVKALKLYGLLDHWDEINDNKFIEKIASWEEKARLDRSLERRLKASRIGQFKPLNEFDWSWPKQCNQLAIQELMTMAFVPQAINVIFCGPNGVGKSTLARNLAYQAVLKGYDALFVTAADMLNELASQSDDSALRRKMKYYLKPQLLVIDEVGYLSYSDRHADLLFAIVSSRYQVRSTVVTTNKPFSDWGDIFPNACCVVSLIDRLVHYSEIISIEADSFRLKEARERSQTREEKGTK